jgi:hypothetical protein
VLTLDLKQGREHACPQLSFFEEHRREIAERLLLPAGQRRRRPDGASWTVFGFSAERRRRHAAY